MNTSKYAPRTPVEQVTLSRAQLLAQDKEKTSRLLHRLQWKAESLLASYHRALAMRGHSDGNGGSSGHRGSSYLLVVGIGGVSGKTIGTRRSGYVVDIYQQRAESMFRVDFFEFYTLLERFITLSLSILGVSVSNASAVSVAPPQNVNALKYITNPDLHRIRPLATHKFHANLLEALEKPDSPLHNALGNQDVQIQLRLAKDYRNRWKDDSEALGDRTKPYMTWVNTKRNAVKLEDLELAKMLHTILIGCDQALDVVQGTNETSSSRALDIRNHYPEEFELMDTDDVPVEYMDDAMDLD